MVVENRAGAGGLVGTDYVSKQAADGYTLLVSHASVHIYATATRRVMPFDPVNDFNHVGMLVEAPMVLLVRAQSLYETFEQYLTAAKTKPVRYGSSGIRLANHLLAEMLKIEGKVSQHDHIPYQGSAPAMQDLLGGQIDSVLDPITTNVAQLSLAWMFRDGAALLVSLVLGLAALVFTAVFGQLAVQAVTEAIQWIASF